MKKFIALLKADLLSILRSRSYISFFAAGGVLLLAAMVIAELSLGETHTIVSDIGLSFLSVTSTLVGCTIIVSKLSAELDQRQALVTLSRPIPRATYVLSKFAAAIVVVFVANLALGALLALTVSMVGGSPAKVFVAAIYPTFEGGIMIAIALAIGVGSSPALTASVVAIMFLLGRLDANLLELINRGTFGSWSDAMSLLARCLPRLSSFDLTGWVSGHPPPSFVVGAGYFVLYTAAFVITAIARLNRRDLA